MCALRTISWSINVEISKNLKKILLTWFYNNAVNIKLTENGRIHKIFHIIDTGMLLDINNLEEFLNREIFLQCNFFKYSTQLSVFICFSHNLVEIYELLLRFFTIIFLNLLHNCLYLFVFLITWLKFMNFSYVS